MHYLYLAQATLIAIALLSLVSAWLFNGISSEYTKLSREWNKIRKEWRDISRGYRELEKTTWKETERVLEEVSNFKR